MKILLMMNFGGWVCLVSSLLQHGGWHNRIVGGGKSTCDFSVVTLQKWEERRVSLPDRQPASQRHVNIFMRFGQVREEQEAGRMRRKSRHC